MSALEQTASAVAAVAGKAAPAVFRIGRDGGRGAGFVLRSGLVLTSAHNLRGPAVTVAFADGRTAAGEVRGADVDGDLSIIAVDSAEAPTLPWPPLPAGRPGIGDAVCAISLLPAGGCRVTAGHISAVGTAFRGPRGRLINDGFEHTAVVGRGSSGGPVVDLDGNLVGVNTHRAGDGLYLAVPATEALRNSVEALARGESPSHRRLGVALAPPHVARRLRAAVGLAARDGLLVREVEHGSAAAAAGLQRGDLVVAVDDRPVGSVDSLLRALDGAGPTVALTVVRGVEEISLEVHLGG